MAEAYNTKVVVVSNRLPQLSALLKKQLDQEMGAAAAAIEAGAKQRNQMFGLVDTSNMINGWTHERVKEHVWLTYTPVEYAVYWEFGHHSIFGNRYEAPKPMLRPAASAVFPIFMAKLRTLLPGGVS